MKQVGLYISQLYFIMRKSRLNNKKNILTLSHCRQEMKPRQSHAHAFLLIRIVPVHLVFCRNKHNNQSFFPGRLKTPFSFGGHAFQGENSDCHRSHIQLLTAKLIGTSLGFFQLKNVCVVKYAVKQVRNLSYFLDALQNSIDCIHPPPHLISLQLGTFKAK